MWETRHSIGDWVYFKTQTLLGTLRTQNKLQEEFCVFSEVEHLFQSAGCARSKRYSSTESEIISLDAGLRMDGLTALDLWNMVIEVLHSTNNTPRHDKLAQGNLVQDRSNCQMWTTYPQTHTLHKVRLSCTIFEDNEALIKMSTKRHVYRTHRIALDWLFDRINFEPKIQIKYVDTNNQLADMLTKESFFSRLMESSSSFAQHHEFLNVLLQPF